MNTFVRNKSSKESLNLGLTHYLNKIDYVEFIYFDKKMRSDYDNVIGRRIIDDYDLDDHHPHIKYSSNMNFFRKILELAKWVSRNKVVIIQFRKAPSNKLCFNENEIENIKYLMGFTPENFDRFNPAIRFIHRIKN